MKKFSLALATIALTVSMASAQFEGPKETLNKIDAKSVSDARYDSWVTLEGNIVKQIYDDLYVFQDNSGTVTVEIDTEEFKGQKVTPETKVKIIGEIGRENHKKIVEVEELEIITQ